MEFPEGYIGLLSEVKYFYTNINNKNDVAGKLTFQGSNDKTKFTDIFTVGDDVKEGWNSHVKQFEVNYLKYRYYRFKGTRTSCRLGEIKLKGVETIKDTQNKYSCPLKLTLGNTVQDSFSHSVEYQGAKTPLLTSISPRYGTVTGGTEVTFTGTGFGTLASGKYKVTIDGVDCPVKTVSDKAITCTTGPRPNLPEQSLDISIDGLGRVSTQGFKFTYAQYWSHESTWNGLYAPLEGESVVVSKGVNLIVDIDRPPNLQLVIVYGSLIFLPDASETHQRFFDARYIYVKKGKFEVGTEAHPYTSKITITLHGNINDPYMPIYGNKVLALDKGILEMHGVARNPTWSQMSETSNKGST